MAYSLCYKLAVVGSRASLTADGQAWRLTLSLGKNGCHNQIVGGKHVEKSVSILEASQRTRRARRKQDWVYNQQQS
ncbi:unnamed protein product [Fusarium venenatum]|uniref:Uncharacterized protein n=1 Tax=Fusarium venenatum TaxID=56646 RepID=A0A2L2TTR1_9HYPO|nr:uncharacterized protein FVRRES_09024 [Fusarium venenatum]CEI68947.1 unnamed protein product [Fusarium venenatum]